MLTPIIIASLLASSPDAPVRSARLLTEAAIPPIRPALWKPVLATAGGAGLALVGLGLVWSGIAVGYWYAFSLGAAAVAMLAVGIFVFAVAVPLTVIGAIKLRQSVRARREFDQARELPEQPNLVTLARF